MGKKKIVEMNGLVVTYEEIDGLWYPIMEDPTLTERERRELEEAKYPKEIDIAKIGRWGKERVAFLKENHPQYLWKLYREEKLEDELIQINEEALKFREDFIDLNKNIEIDENMIEEYILANIIRV